MEVENSGICEREMVMEKMGGAPVQMKLSEVYRAARKTAPDVGKVKREREVCFGVVKQEPVNCLGNVVICSGLEVVKGELGVQSRCGSFPGLLIPRLVKRELLSPGSCVTSDSMFREGETAHVDGCHAMSGLVAPVTLTPVKSLAAVQDDERPGISGDCSTLEVPVTAAALVVKAEAAAVEFGEKVVTAPGSCGEEVVCGEEVPHVQSSKLEALDMSLTGMQNVEHPRGCEARGEDPSAAHVQSRKIEACDDALDVSPTVVQKVEVCVEGPSTAHVQSRKLALDILTTEVQEVAHPLGCEETSHAPVKSVVAVHVKSEPVETQADDFSLKEPFPRLSLRTGVKEELPLTCTPTGVLSQAQASSETEHSSSSDSEESEDEEEAVETPPRRRSQLPEESQKEAKNRNPNPGRRIQGGRIYDSSLGRTCHWCRQKTVEHHAKCRECTIHYCGPCLMNRNGENVMEELAEGVKWLCPKCRNGCGPGCENCCNCGPCRKAGGKAPTGQLINKAKNAGFQNVHDYLVHLETGEGPDEIAERKVGRDWINCGRFEWKESSSQAHGEPSSDDSSDEFTLNEVTSTQLHEGKIGMKFVKRFVQSQLKRKRGQMRGAMPPKRTQVEASSARRNRDDVRSIIARLKVPSAVVRRTGNEVGAAATTRNNSVVEENTAPRSQSDGMRVKREFSDVGGSHAEVAKRRKLEVGQGHVSSASGPFSRVKCEPETTTSLSENNPSVVNSNEAGPRRKFTVDSADRASSVSESELTYNMRHGGADEQRGLECPSDAQGTEYRTKLKFALAQPFDAKELEILEESVRCRKPVQKLRQTRGRVVDVVTEDEGFSYLDHHQDFAFKLEEAQSLPVKLALLRGFFFWLQHTCMEGAFKPWPAASHTESRPQSEDCMETEGPDCQVTAVVLQLDEGKDALEPESSNEIYCHDMVQGPTESMTTCHPLGSQALTQSLIPFKARKNPVDFMKLPKMKGQLVTVQPYRVVLCLPAPALCKMMLEWQRTRSRRAFWARQETVRKEVVVEHIRMSGRVAPQQFWSHKVHTVSDSIL